MALERNDVIGIIPCAGIGSRLGHLPFSKELYPLGVKEKLGKTRVKVVSEYLIAHLMDAGVRNIHFVLRKGKWDIPSYFGGGIDFGFAASYHVADYGYGVPFSVYQVTRVFPEKKILLGFPDILFKPEGTYIELLKVLDDSEDISIVLGVMPVLKPEKWDMVKLDSQNNVTDLVIKSEEGLKQDYGWTIAAWKPEFSVFFNHKITELLENNSSEYLANHELFFGHILQDAINDGMKVRSVVFQDGNCLDIGTPDDLETSNSFLST